MHQLALGAAIPFLVMLVLYARAGFRASVCLLVISPACMILGAIWAVVPDLPRVLGNMPLYYRLAKDPRMDIFFWHYSIDIVEYHAFWHVPLVLAMLAALLFVAWRELRLREDA